MNRNSNNVHKDVSNPSKQTHHQVEDAALKLIAQYFADQLVPYFHIEGEVDHIGPTESVHLELRKMYQDINLVMKDGSWIHFEFQSSNNHAPADLKRFRLYEAHVSQQYDVDVRTYVLYSGTIKNPMTEFTCGFNTYRVQPIIMKGHLAEEVFANIDYKIEHHVPLSQEDLVPLTLCPLMSSNMSQKDKISKALQIIRHKEITIPNADVIEAVIFAMASKYLKSQDFEQLKEEIKMTELGEFIYNDGMAQGIETASMENARNFFSNGISFEVVRASITNLSDEVLQDIYNEVMASKERL